MDARITPKPMKTKTLEFMRWNIIPQVNYDYLANVEMI